MKVSVRKVPLICVLLVVAPVILFSIRTSRYNRYAGNESQRSSLMRDEMLASEQRCAILTHPIGKLTLRRTRFEDALGDLHSLTGVKFDVHWDRVGRWGVSPDARVTNELSDVSLATALKAILEQASVRKPYLTYRCNGGVIVVSTYEELTSRMVCRMYRVEDIVARIPPKQAIERVGPNRARVVALRSAERQIADRVESDMRPWESPQGSPCGAICLGGRLFVAASVSRQCIASISIDNLRHGTKHED